MEGEYQKTLFVRNLPFDIKNERLEDVFSEIGPVKSCFVVTDKETGKCRGFGYVKYSTKEDAERAKDEIKSIDGRKLFIHFATKKPKKKKTNERKKSVLSDDDSESITEDGSDKEDSAPKPQSSEPRKPAAAIYLNTLAKEKHKAACTVVVKNVDPALFDEPMKNVLNNLKNMRKIIYPVHGQPSSVAAVIMKSKRDALKAVKYLNNAKDNQMSAQLLLVERAASKEQWQPKKCRLIIRNLPFSINEKKLKKAFAPFGNITDVTIPKKSDGKMLGYGFVQYATVDEAFKAINEMNAKPLLGRPVAVDWAVPKNKFETLVSSEVKTDASKKSTSKEENKTEKQKASKGDRKMKTENKSDEESASDVEEELDEDSESEEDLEEDTQSEENYEEDSQSEEDLEESGSQDDSDDSSEDEMAEKNQMQKKRPLVSDVNEGKTLFIRNLSYDTEEEDLKELMEQFGKLNYCRLVIDPDTDHPRGTAFVQFKEKSDADKALEAGDSENGPGLVLDGRKLNLLQALPREKAVTLKKELKKKEEKDNRNLYLAREGMIRPGTKAAEGLSAADLNLRMKIDAVKRQKLKNPNIFISPLRICVHNLPLHVDDKQLKKATLKILDDKAATITECRIMRDLTRVNSNGVARSRGYAFITFTEHKHALKALHALNNNADIFGKRRLIAEFSLENREALVAKEKRLQRSKIKMEILNKTKKTFVDVKIKKRNRDRKKQDLSLNSDKLNEEDDVSGPAKKKPKGLPSHWGPKIRHRDRGKNVKVARKPKDKISRTKAREIRQNHKVQNTRPVKKRARKAEPVDSLDHLIQKYRQRFSNDISRAKRPEHRSKWFD